MTLNPLKFSIFNTTQRSKKSRLTCGKLSGRDSKITSKTPIGTVTCFSSSPSESFVLLSTLPTLVSDEAAICFNPSLSDLSFDGVRDNLDNKGFARPELRASSRSLPLASRISFCRDSRRSARVLMHPARSSGIRDCSTRPPIRADGQRIRET